MTMIQLDRSFDNSPWATVPERFGDRGANRKRLSSGSHRVLELEDTIARVLERSEVIGLTRIADLTDLDVLGIPNYATICPELNQPASPGGISVMSGKGLTRAHALASALMEAVERHAGLQDRRPTIRGSWAQLSRHHNVLHPTSYVVPESFRIGDDDPLDWVAARSLFRQDTVLVPACTVFVPYEPTTPTIAHRPSSSNGLASGNTVEEATLHAIYELIERDAESFAVQTRQVRDVDLSQVPWPEVRELAARFEEAGLNLRVKDITGPIPVPTFLATALDPSLPATMYANGGKGTHLDPRVAMTRAICEVAQSRVVGMSGIREDMVAKRGNMAATTVEALVAEYPEWYGPAEETLDLSTIEDRSTANTVDDLKVVLEDLARVGIPDVAVVDLTRPEAGIPVARACVPLMEFEGKGNWMGPRLSRALGELGRDGDGAPAARLGASTGVTVGTTDALSANGSSPNGSSPSGSSPNGHLAPAVERRAGPRIRVFLGPSLPVEEARGILDADYRPPIRDGDVEAALADGVEVIGIIDAAFIQGYTATPTQLLEALRSGVVIFGAASAGALRAVELDRYGLRGVGEIYHLYRSGFDAEDELAVAFDPDSGRSLTEAMINVRSVCAGARDEGIIGDADHDRLVEAAKGVYFAHRTYPAIGRAATSVDPEVRDRFVAWAQKHRGRLNRKAADARACLAEIAAYAEAVAAR